MSINKLENKYQKKSDREHILDNPDTYIGSVELITSQEFILNNNTDDKQDNKAIIIRKNITYNPGLYKLFDEGIVNCRDHVVRMLQKSQEQDIIQVKNIEITIDKDGTITMFNDGNGIDVAQHPEHKIWIPEMIFGHLRTSTNYNKDEKRIVGGKNGFGFKLVLIWSTTGTIETLDHIRGLKYVQSFQDNLNVIEKPKITKATKSRPYTRVIFKPDYKRLGINISNGVPIDIINHLKRRVYDIAAVTDKSVRVKLNNEIVPVKTFQNYIELVLQGTDYKYESGNERWEYAVALTPIGEFMQYSFVNGIYTSKGGRHVEYILNQITKQLIEYINKKKKVEVKPSVIKEQIALFIRCDIENPAFDSQTKDYMNLPASKFGSGCEVSSKFIDKIAKMGIMDSACEITDIKENRAAKKNDGVKSKNVRGIPKLIDANYAGTSKSNQCSIILCEGDSAKAGIVSGLSREDRNYIGIYPMKGKLLNIRGETVGKIGDNREINEIKQIIGLEHGRVYTPESVKTSLRYGKIIFMTDQDLDGSHIKGLGINIIDSEWQSLIEIPEFIGYMNTPILKATQNNGKKQIEFYNDGEFNDWKKDNDVSKWNIKYYKGLGTSTGQEFKKYFEKKRIVYFQKTKECGDIIDKIFNKKRANDRKDWLADYSRERYLDTNNTTVSYREFINNDLIHFSKYDNDRSIPNLTDGLKISLRKILYSAFKKTLNKEIKVAQFSGYVSEHSGYHHGEASLNGAIVGLAQDFVGSNNINLFLPKGQFGTRLMGGKDSASERYIFTQLNSITRLIYPELDDAVLDYLDDDGDQVEPVYYVPIIPMVLVNGTKGIGTGFSTDVMCYNPVDIINYIELMLSGKTKNEIDYKINPYYRGFKGEIYNTDSTFKKYVIKGCYKLSTAKDKITISELPIGTWTQDYKEFLETLINTKKTTASDKKSTTANKKSENVVKDFKDMSTESNVEFEIQFYPGVLETLINQKHDYGINGIEKYLKLYSTQSTTNMHLFNAKEQLRKYEDVYEIIDDYYSIRYGYYNKRRLYLIDKLGKELKTLSNKARYIQNTLDDNIDLRKKSREQIDKMLETMKFDKHVQDKNYNYLIKMPMDSVSQENVERLKREHGQKESELNAIKSSTVEDMWLKELNELKKHM